MKATKTPKHSPNPAPRTTPQTVPVRFELHHSTAFRVCIAGTFNEWNPSATAMKLESAGHWVIELALPPGTYEYCFVVDNIWMADPRAAETAPNAFGGLNSVLRVSAPTQAAA